MRRTKEWWSGLTKLERIKLYWLEKDKNFGGRSAYIPDDCSECGHCGTPHLHSGLCPSCLDKLIDLIDKADNHVKEVNS